MKPVLVTVTAIVIMLAAAASGFLAHQWLNPSPAPGITADSKPAREDVIGSQRPDFSLPDLQGETRSIAEWDGKLLVINFWATWCPPCLEEIPVFVSLQEEYRSQGLQFLGIALQDAEEVRDFVAETAMNYPVLTGYREVIKIASTLGNHMGALPYTVIVNREGVVKFIHAGPLDLDAARTTILNYL